MITAQKLQMAAAGVGEAGFSPADINDLHLWLDATDSSTLFQDTSKTTSASANNDPIGCWADKSGNGFDHDQSTNAYRPYLDTGTMSLNSLSFDKTLNSDYGQWLENSTCTNTITVFQVVRFPNSSNCGVSLGMGASANAYAHFFSGSSGVSVYTSAPNYRTISGTFSRLNLQDVIYSCDMVNFIRQNGVQNAINNPYNYPTGSSTLVGSYVGRRGLTPTNHAAFDGNIGEIIAYDRRLSSSEIGQVESFLSAKWSITI